MGACWGLKRTRAGVKGGYAPLVHDVIIDIKSDKRHKECHGYNA